MDTADQVTYPICQRSRTLVRNAKTSYVSEVRSDLSCFKKKCELP